MELIFGAGKIDRPVGDLQGLLSEWRDKEKDWGQLYLEYQPVTPRDRVLVEDLAVTMLVNSLVAARAARGVFANGASLDLSSLPDKALEETTAAERQAVAALIGTVATWPGISASIATKTLHKKRPALIPILDNRAIFEAYMSPLWPEKRTVGESVKAVPRIAEALDSIAEDLTRPENASVWPQLHVIEPERTRIELFDMIWWMYFRQVEPVAGAPAEAARPE